jgi:hypothetical protein
VACIDTCTFQLPLSTLMFSPCLWPIRMYFRPFQILFSYFGLVENVPFPVSHGGWSSSTCCWIATGVAVFNSNRRNLLVLTWWNSCFTHHPISIVISPVIGEQKVCFIWKKASDKTIRHGTDNFFFCELRLECLLQNFEGLLKTLTTN